MGTSASGDSYVLAGAALAAGVTGATGAGRGDDDAHFGDRLEETNSFDNHHNSYR